MKIIYNKFEGKEFEADKRFLCFAFCQYYPVGGLEDIEASFDDIESAIRYITNDTNEYKYIYDRVEGKSVDPDEI